MFAIVDVETTGGNSSTEKITEICIVLHDGLQVTDYFTTLINPEQEIPANITHLTGITNEMTSVAPKFYEIAKKIIELTEERIFVAHNASFDYNFIRNEFRSLGYEFSRKKVCTVRLSRKLLPGHRSYSLGKLCKDLGIIIENRHRARGDAFATAKLFELLLERDRKGVINRSKEIDTMFARAREGTQTLVDHLPASAGVYYFHDSNENIIYIGKSLNIHSRVISHLSNTASKKSVSMANNVHRVSYELTGSGLVALLLESHQIKKHKPVYNRSLTRSSFSIMISACYDTEGFLRLEISRKVPSSEPLVRFVNKEEARNFMNSLAEEFMLCRKLCGLDHTEKACFYYGLKKCRGACAGKENAESYNKRVEDAIGSLCFDHKSFFVVEKGRTDEEYAAIKVERGKYCGFGFVNAEEPVYDLQQLHDSIRYYEDNRDVHYILRNYLASGSARLIHF